MNGIFSSMQSEWMKALGWTFIHSLWQIALVGLLLFLVLRWIPGRSAHIRYTVSAIALWLIVVLAVGTFIIMLPETREITLSTGQVFLISATETLSSASKISTWLEARMPMLLMIWLGGVSILMIRLLASLVWVRHIRTTSDPLLVIQDHLDQLIHRLKLPVTATVSESGFIPSPLTIGYWKPLILFPVGLVNQLGPKEIEAVLTHELAHIVRKDYMSNLVQSFIETLFYYHPVTWWISGMVRAERENRADDLAVKWCGDQLLYAKTLMTVQQMQTKGTPALAIGFASRKGVMLTRIQRILNIPYKNHNQMEKTVLLSLCSLCFLAFTFTTKNIASKDTSSSSQPELEVTVTVPADTLPSKGIYRIHKKTDEQEVKIEVEDGDIKSLTIDGKQIEPSEYEAYDDVIEDMFGNVQGSPAPEVIGFPMIPGVPGIPPAPGNPELFYFEIPAMPPIPAMPEIPGTPGIHPFNYNYLLEGNHLKCLEDGDFALWSGEGDRTIKIISTDSLPGGNCRMIIYLGNDSIIHEMPYMNGLHLGDYLDNKEWKQLEKEWKEQWKSQEGEWKAYADEWKAQGEKWKLQWEEHAKMLENQNHEHLQWNEMRQHEMEEQLRAAEQEMAHIYSYRTPRLSISDEMVRDGLIESGEEVEVQLTPDRLKINGEKMPDSVHQKYLRMYEAQQGVELSGNSRVEFTTKSKQRM